MVKLAVYDFLDLTLLNITSLGWLYPWVGWFPPWRKMLHEAAMIAPLVAYGCLIGHTITGGHLRYGINHGSSMLSARQGASRFICSPAAGQMIQPLL